VAEFYYGRWDLDLFHLDTAPRVSGRGLGIEDLLGLSYKYDIARVLGQASHIPRDDEVVSAAERVLGRFYSKTSELPEDLAAVQARL
jgi:hypothetical protein